jgi:AbrB family looped-hinge helix DNA binding protein
MDTSVVTTKGQVVIPSKLRHKYGIKSGTRIHFYGKEEEIRMVPLTHSVIDANFGFLRTKGSLKKALFEEKKWERAR